MTMVPVRDQRICPVCGEAREGGCHACPGPRQAVVTDHEGADLVMLPGDDPHDADRALRNSHRWGQEENWRPGVSPRPLPPMPQPLTDRIMADLIAHPDAKAAQIALRLDAHQRIVFDLLSGAMRRGLVSRRKDKTTWRWTAIPQAAEP